MKDSIHQKQDELYPHNHADEAKLLDENDVANPHRLDVTEDERITEVEEFAGSEEGIGVRDEDGLHLDKDVKEDREDNTEGRLPDIPPSAIIR
jgi:hypothetical protein